MQISEATLCGIELVDKKGKCRKQLPEENNLVVVEVVREIKWMQLMMSEWPKKCNPKADVSHGYDISRSKVNQSVATFHNSNFSLRRQKIRQRLNNIQFRCEAAKEFYCLLLV